MKCKWGKKKMLGLGFGLEILKTDYSEHADSFEAFVRPFLSYNITFFNNFQPNRWFTVSLSFI